MTRRVRLGGQQQRVLELIDAGFKLRASPRGDGSARLYSPDSKRWYPAKKQVLISLFKAGLLVNTALSGVRLTGKPWHSGYYRAEK